MTWPEFSEYCPHWRQRLGGDRRAAAARIFAGSGGATAVDLKR
jgi:hypothetical protein